MTPQEIDLQVQEIDLLHRGAKYAQVVARGEAVLRFSPQNLPLLRILGYAYLGLKDFARARQHLESALRYDPDRARGLCSVAKVLVACERFEEASPLFQSAFSEHTLNSFEGFEDWYLCELELKRREDPRETQGPKRAPDEILKRALTVCEIHEHYTFVWLERLVKNGIFNAVLERKFRDYLTHFTHREDAWVLLVRALAEKGITEKVQHELDSYRKRVGHTTTWLDLLRYTSQFQRSSLLQNSGDI